MWLTVLCYFKMYSEVTQLYIYICLLFFKFCPCLGHYVILSRVPSSLRWTFVGYSEVVMSYKWVCIAFLLSGESGGEGLRALEMGKDEEDRCDLPCISIWISPSFDSGLRFTCCDLAFGRTMFRQDMVSCPLQSFSLGSSAFCPL